MGIDRQTRGRPQSGQMPGLVEAIVIDNKDPGELRTSQSQISNGYQRLQKVLGSIGYANGWSKSWLDDHSRNRR